MERKFIIDEKLYRMEHRGNNVTIECAEVLNEQAINLPVQTQEFVEVAEAEKYFGLLSEVLRYIAGGQEASMRPSSMFPHQLKPLI